MNYEISSNNRNNNYGCTIDSIYSWITPTYRASHRRNYWYLSIPQWHEERKKETKQKIIIFITTNTPLLMHRFSTHQYA